MSVCAVVVTYNRLSLLKECLTALMNESLVDHILVVDNDSDDDTYRYLKSLNNQIIYKRLDNNIGGAGGFSKGIECFISETEDDYVWIMDDDTIVKNSSLHALLEAGKSIGDFGFLVSNSRWIDGTASMMNLPHIDNKKWTERLTSDTSLVQVKRASFVSLLVPRKVVLKVGLPISEFFIWGDDVEYTTRISNEYNCYFVPASMITHKMKQNTGINIFEEDPERVDRYFYEYRNGFYNAKNISKIKAMKFWALSGLTIIKLIVKHKKGAWKKVVIILKGLIAGLRFNPKIVYFS